MKTMDISNETINLSANFLSGRNQCVQFSGSTLGYLPKHTGVGQETISRPLYWLAFTDPHSLTAEKDTACSTVKYVDDIRCYEVSSLVYMVHDFGGKGWGIWFQEYRVHDNDDLLLRKLKVISNVVLW